MFTSSYVNTSASLGERKMCGSSSSPKPARVEAKAEDYLGRHIIRHPYNLLYDVVQENSLRNAKI